MIDFFFELRTIPDNVIETLLHPHGTPSSKLFVDAACCPALYEFQDVNQAMWTDHPENCVHAIRHDHKGIKFNSVPV